MTTPSSPPISMDHIGDELRIARGVQFELGDALVKRLAGLPPSTVAVSMDQLLGKTRGYWGTAVVTQYINSLQAAVSGTGGSSLAPASDAYFPGASIVKIDCWDGSSNGTDYRTDVEFSGAWLDSSMDALLQVLDLSTNTVLRQIRCTVAGNNMTSADPSGPTGNDRSHQIFLSPGTYDIRIVYVPKL
ncbi:hypothetical protein [Cupriavidus numazuensis]|uniref:Bacteriophage protein n=1 Tax=Cupriavidus numazuensis TaxID=221992 RepID=A0ABN7PPH9_9BURK|nr:hypothetical protein [Cupriavidus numazuensis]CAG2129093.1 hypothetical protein LMG26411_00116 [Cupriavidus numazuensis]